MKKFSTETVASILVLISALIYGCGDLLRERTVSTAPSKLVLKNGSELTCMGGVSVLELDQKDVAYRCYRDQVSSKFIEYKSSEVLSYGVM